MKPQDEIEASEGGLPAVHGSASSFWWPLWKHMHAEHGLILVESECDAIAGAVNESRSAVRGPVAMIKRAEHPQHYYGNNQCGPMWTSSPMHAAAVPGSEVQDLLTEIAGKCPNVWAVIYPQNK